MEKVDGINNLNTILIKQLKNTYKIYVYQWL